MTVANTFPQILDRAEGRCALAECTNTVPAGRSKFCCDEHSRAHWRLKKRELRFLDRGLYRQARGKDPAAYPKYLKRWNGSVVAYNAFQKQVMRTRRAHEKALKAGLTPAFNLAA